MLPCVDGMVENPVEHERQMAKRVEPYLEPGRWERPLELHGR